MVVVLCASIDVTVHVRHSFRVVGRYQLAYETQAYERDGDSVVSDAELVDVVEPAVSAASSTLVPDQTGGVEDSSIYERVRYGRWNRRTSVQSSTVGIAQLITTSSSSCQWCTHSLFLREKRRGRDQIEENGDDNHHNIADNAEFLRYCPR